MSDVSVRQRRPEDTAAVIEIFQAIYPGSPSWTPAQLASHLEVFPEGQMVAEAGDRIVGMAASLIVLWDDYSMDTAWRDFTDNGFFRNHDPERGRTLYGAEVMVHPDYQGLGVGTRLYDARRALVRRLGLLRIRAGARLAGYHRYADSLSPEEYTRRVAAGQLSDPTLSFQLARGFAVIGIAHDYLRYDPESQGHAAVIEWLNPDVATPADYTARQAWASAS